MRTYNALHLTVASFLLLLGCGGTVQTSPEDDTAVGGRPTSSGGESGDGDGDIATGGRAVGGSPGAGGRPATGGSVGAGGRPVGGSVGAGGRPVGGSVGAGGQAVGGQPAAGGSWGGSGGRAGTGGTMAGGGSVGIGGSIGAGGGIIPTGGQPGTGGNLGDCVLHDFFESDRYCQASATCPAGPLWTYCDNGYCSCESNRGSFQFELENLQGAASCKELIAACAEDPFDDPISKEICETARLEQGRDYCGMGTECRVEAPLSNGDTAIAKRWKDVWCEKYDDTWTCECSSQQSSLRVELADDYPSPEACIDVSEQICDHAAELDPDAAPACERTSQSANRDWCDIQLECSYPATINDRTANIIQFHWGSCYADSSGSWNCSCDNASEFPVMAVDGWEACTQLTERCAQP